MTGFPQDLIPENPQPPRSEADFSPPGDYYAPYFDVVFYRPSPLQGTIENLEEQSQALRAVNPGAAAALAAQVSALRGSSPLDIAGKQEIGASNLSLRSIGGGLQTFNPSGPDSELGQLVNYRANLQVTMLSAAALQATLTLTPPYEDAVRIIDSQAIKFGSLMEIQWGYLSTDGGGQPAISDKGLFRITQPSIKFGREVTITISGFDILSSSLSTLDTRCQWLRETYPCDLSILKQIIKKRAPGYVLNDSFVGTESPLRRNKSGDSVIQADSDWVFFRRLCRQNDVSFMQIYTTIFLYDEHRIDMAQPKYRLTWFMQPTGALDIPMISFETNPIMGYFAMEGSRGQRTFCRDSETNELLVSEQTPSNTGVGQVGASGSDATPAGHSTTRVRVATGAEIAAFAAQEEECSSGRIFTQPCRRSNRTEETVRENREVRRFHNTRATAVVPGVPGLIPQQIAEVVNVGDIFSGCYRIMKTIHTIGAGYTVKVDLLRSSSTGTPNDGTPETRDRANCQAVDPNVTTGEERTPTQGDDPPIISTEETNAGCVDAARTGAAQELQTIIRATTFGAVSPRLVDLDAQLQAVRDQAQAQQPPAGP